MLGQLKDERGLSLVELLGVISLLGIISALFSGTFYLIVQASSFQGQIVAYQQTANQIRTQVEAITRIDGIYQRAGYLGKYDSKKFQEEHIVKVVSADQREELALTSEGANQLYLTNINDTLNQQGQLYQLKNPQVKLKFIQQKNENEATKTHYYMPNYRDTFTIQTKCFLLFYKGTIDFDKYYNSQTGWWQLDKLQQENQHSIVYQRSFTVTYRDDEKASGGVPGNGRW
ncbi:pilus assembly FimT family protein [Enterococcus faecalis]